MALTDLDRVETMRGHILSLMCLKRGCDVSSTARVGAPKKRPLVGDVDGGNFLTQRLHIFGSIVLSEASIDRVYSTCGKASVVSLCFSPRLTSPSHEDEKEGSNEVAAGGCLLPTRR